MNHQASSGATSDSRDREVRQWAMFVHLSRLAAFVLPVAGLAVPIVIWQLKKDDLPEIDGHGMIVVNWMISAIIYGFVSFLLVFALIGVPLLIALSALSILFPIIGGIKAGNGEVWRYPLSIPFLK
jgi:uncharacterized Tic20 family protein